MSDYISREAAIERLNKLCDRVCQYSKAQRNYMCGACPLGDAFTVVEDDIPAADVQPVVRGKWNETKRVTDKYGFESIHWKCSSCGIEIETVSQIYDISAWHFCPNCGADMRGDG